MKRLLTYMYGIIPFFVAELIMALAYNILILIYRKAIEIKIGLEMKADGVVDSAKLVQAVEDAISREVLYLVSVIALLICGIVFFFWYKQEIRFEVRGSLRNLLKIKTVLLFLILGVGFQFFFSGVMNLIQPFLTQIFTDYAKAIDVINSGSKIVVFFQVILVAPIVEELIFRGLILHKTSKVIPFLGANILQALLFAIYHWNIVQGIYALLIGFVFGLIYHKFKTIFAPILLHMFINASSFLAILFPGNVLSHVIMVVIGGLFVVIALLMIKAHNMSMNMDE
ncbi:MAG: CPBP family intramembrane glutamic endopeptidase [Mobilitalea sp.]